MIGKLTSLAEGPKRNVNVAISPTEVHSEISSPAGTYSPEQIDHYEIAGANEAEGLLTLEFVLVDRQRVRFYSTYSRGDMMLLLDQLDGTIGERPRKGLSRDG